MWCRNRVARGPHRGSRGFLGQKLPEYMVPAAFVLLKRLPLTPSGKVNRRTLPAAEPGRPEDAGAPVPPRTPVEAVVAGIWAELLGVQKVGIHDNFFELGGHSLLAARVLSRMHDALQVELPLHCLFEGSTVAGLAGHVEAARQQAGRTSEVPALAPVNLEGDLPLSFAQQRLRFLDQLQPGGTAYNIPYAVRLTGPLNLAGLEQTLEEIVRRHAVLRTTYTAVAGQPSQRIAPAAPWTLPVLDLSGLPDAEREPELHRLLKAETRQPFDLARDSMLRGRLLRLGEQDHVLVLTLHHIAADGWSLSVLFTELTTLYAAFAACRPSPLPDLPLQYADYAVWQRHWLQGEVLEETVGIFAHPARRCPGAYLELPTDFSRPAVQSYRGARQPLVLDQELTKALGELSRREGVTLFMTLLAAFQTLLARYSGQEDIVVGCPIAGHGAPSWKE